MFDTTGIAVFIGLDVGKGDHHAHGLTAQGKTVLNKRLPNSEPKLRAIMDKLTSKFGSVLLVVDQVANIGALPVAVARDAGAKVAYLPGLAMRRAADIYLAGKTASATRSTSFVRWAVTHHHAPKLTAPATRWTGPAGPLDQDRRWTDARRLLHDDSYPTADRVAGLLILLYAQKLNVISTLTTQHLRHIDGQTMLALGSRPVVLPAPLDRLVNELADATGQTPGSSLINTPSTWLFPGRWPGRPLTEGALARRLRAHGLQPRQDRNTALFMLAAEVPAAILAKTLGIHIKAAIQWQQLSNGDWTTYAADLSQRSPGHSNSSNS